jgi:Fic family protein
VDPKAFVARGAGRLVRTSAAGAEHWAFVPVNLPPEISYDHELVIALSRADRALGELAGLGRTIPNPRLLYQPFMRREAVLSSRIEGTQADVRDLYALEAGKATYAAAKAGAESDTQEVLNYLRAMQYGLERVETLPVSLRLIQELHERLMRGVRGGHSAPGDFRRIQNWIGPEGRPISDSRFVPPPVPEMTEALQQLELYFHAEDDTPPLVRLALSHYQFETIHPFSDGNGRIGRLLVVLLLVHWKLLPAPLLYLSAYFERHRQHYYDLLLGVSQKGAWREWVVFFLSGVAEQALDAVNRAKRLLDLQGDYRRRLSDVRGAAPLRLVEELFESPFFTVPRARDVLSVSYNAARSNLDRLVEANILSPLDASEGGPRLYVADELVDIINDRA